MSTFQNRMYGSMGDMYSSVLSGAFPSAWRPLGTVVRFFSIDGTFLLGKYMDTLLIAIGCDSNNALVPLAFALVEKENKDS